MKFAYMMLLAGSVGANSQIFENDPPSMAALMKDDMPQTLIEKQDAGKLGPQKINLIGTHPEFEHERKQLALKVHHKIKHLAQRLSECGEMLDNQTDKAELEATKAQMEALDLKIKRSFKWDAKSSTLEMWKLEVDTEPFKEVARDIDQEIDDAAHDIEGDMNNIVDRLKQMRKNLRRDKNFKVNMRKVIEDIEKIDLQFERLRNQIEENIGLRPAGPVIKNCDWEKGCKFQGERRNTVFGVTFSNPSGDDMSFEMKTETAKYGAHTRDGFTAHYKYQQGADGSKVRYLSSITNRYGRDPYTIEYQDKEHTLIKGMSFVEKREYFLFPLVDEFTLV